MIEIRRIGEDRREDINIKNEPFSVFGRMIPAYDGEKWSYTTEKFDEAQTFEMTFPNENYDYDDMKGECFFAGAYDGEKCVGIAIYRREWFKYLYLDDLKINRECRGLGVGKMLIDAGARIAAENGYRGVYTIGQDNNLAACSFYIKCGFAIGGLNTRVYTGTRQEGKSDIYFYKDN